MLTATELAAAVRGGSVGPFDVVADALKRISRQTNGIDLFQTVRGDSALAAACALTDRADLAELPLAGVPIAVKESDGDVVERIRGAGAIVVGQTRTTELDVWTTSDTAEAIVRNPWVPTFTAGGSSAGSAAAVASGLVPIAHGIDTFGSLCASAATCGVVGITPGDGTVRARDSRDWSATYTHGSLAATVSDVALLLSVLAERPELRAIAEPTALRIAVSMASLTRKTVPAEFITAVVQAAQSLTEAGHRVQPATPNYGNIAPAIFTRWLAGPRQPFGNSVLEPRTRTHLRFGRLVRPMHIVSEGSERAWVARAQRFFADHDVLITPTLACLPALAERWSEKSWLANTASAVALTPFLAPWRLAGFPTISIPVGRHPSGLPIGAQLVAAPGNESALLSVAAQLERRNPWPHTVLEGPRPARATANTWPTFGLVGEPYRV